MFAFRKLCGRPLLRRRLLRRRAPEIEMEGPHHAVAVAPLALHGVRPR